MAIDELVAALEREAEAEIAAIRAAARDEADRLAAAAAARRAASTRAAVDVHRAGVQAGADAELAAATRRAMQEVLAARARMLDRLRAAITAELPGLADPAVRERLRAAARDAAGDGAIREGSDATGLRIEIEGGRVTIDATLSSLFARLWPRLRIAAVREVAP